jgi:hypothetical protein
MKSLTREELCFWAEQAAKQFVGQKIGGLTLDANGRLIDTKPVVVYRKPTARSS